MDGCQEHKLGALGVLSGAGNYVFGGVLFHFLSAHGRIRAANGGVEQAHIFVDLRRCAHRGSRIAGHDPLLNSNGGRQSLDEIDLGFGHTAQKLACVGREALDVAPLPLGIKGVEGER